MKISKRLLFFALVSLLLTSCGGFNNGFSKQKYLKGNLKQVFGENSDISEKSTVVDYHIEEEVENPSLNSSLESYHEVSEDREEETSFQDSEGPSIENFERTKTNSRRDKSNELVLEEENKQVSKSIRSHSGWAAVIFGIFGFFIILGGFVLIILTTILPWWWFLIGLGAIIFGCLMIIIGAIISGGKGAALGSTLAAVIALIFGSISLIIWGIVELIIWLVG